MSLTIDHRLRQSIARGVAESALSGLLLSLLGPIAVRLATGVFEPVLMVALMGTFCVCLAGSTWLRMTAGARTSGDIDLAVGEARRQLFDALRTTDVRQVEARPELLDEIPAQLQKIDGFPLTLIDSARVGVVVASYTVNIGLLSLTGMLIWLFVAGMIIRLTLPVHRSLRANASRQRSLDVTQRINQLVSGFSQLKLDRRAADDALADLSSATEELEREHLATADRILTNDGLVQVLMLIGVGWILFTTPAVSDISPDVLAATVMLFFFAIVQTNFAIRHSLNLEVASLAWQHLAQIHSDLHSGASTYSGQELLPVESIELVDIRFRYGLDDALGPINLTFKPGEIVFVVGANGSGKTTLMKLLTGLYTPASGSIRLNGWTLMPDQVDDYRQLFTAVFTDHHLFEELYGLEHCPPAQVCELLERFGLGDIVQLRNGRFSTVKLSTGQRQRLAMVVALLEDRPVYVLDEWSAHQDPTLRDLYYREVLPALRARGCIVIAVSHDPRYFALADRVVYLRDGQVAAQRP